MEEVGLEVHLSNCYKVEQMRKARGDGQDQRQGRGLDVAAAV